MLVICFVGVGGFLIAICTDFLRFRQSSLRLSGARVFSNDICVETLQVFGFRLHRRTFKLVGDIVLCDFLVLVFFVLRRSTL